MKTLRGPAGALVLAAAVLAAAAARDDERERKLIGVLRSDAPPQEKAMACKQLALCGTGEAVPALAPLLENEQLASWARIALEVIPGPAVDEALREALGRLKGRLRVGVIHSIGVRRDAKAVEGLARLLKEGDAEEASAAAVSLGRIGGEEAVRALEPALEAAPPPVRSAAAEGLILCAERLLSEGKAERAAGLYDRVRRAEVARPRILEATRGAILARGAGGLPLLTELLRSEDRGLFGIGLTVARELPGAEATGALAAELGRLAPERQPLLVLALADRADPAVLPVLRKVMREGPKESALAALGSMERTGNASCVPDLLKLALGEDRDLSAAAKAGLMKLPGPEVEADYLARLPRAAGRERALLIELAGRRRIEGALPALVAAAGEADPEVRAAAVSALGALGGTAQVPDLVKILLKAEPGERDGLEKALSAVAARGGADAVPALEPLARSREGALRVIALHAMAGAGGPAALAAVRKALEDPEEAVRDEAVRTLANWPNRWPEEAGVLEPLEVLARSAPKAAHRILALRGVLQHLQGNRRLPDEERLARLRALLPLAARPDEKRLAVSVLGTIPAGGALDLLAELAGDPAVAEEACAAIVGLAERKDLKGAAPDQRRRALQTAADKARSEGTRKRAGELLRAAR